MQFLQTAYFTTRVSQHTEEDCLNLKHKPTHRRSPPRPAQTPEIVSSALQDRGDGISTAPLQQEPGLLLQLGAEREITPHHLFSPPPRTRRWNWRSLFLPLPCGKTLIKVSSAALHDILKTQACKESGAVFNLLSAGSSSRTFCCCRGQYLHCSLHLTKAEQLFLYPLAIKTQTIYPIVSYWD